MLGRNNYTTILLVIIVLILLFGVGIAVYYALDLEWFKKKTNVQIYNEADLYNEKAECEEKTLRQIKYDISKRTYNLILETDSLKIIVYKDGTVGITVTANKTNNDIEIYEELLNKEIKLTLKNIIRAYNVSASNGNGISNYIVLLDVDGNLYKLEEKELLKNGKQEFDKIEGIAKIVDIKQITNEGLVENTKGVNVVAIDEESNELLLTNYLICK